MYKKESFDSPYFDPMVAGHHHALLQEEMYPAERNANERSINGTSLGDEATAEGKRGR